MADPRSSKSLEQILVTRVRAGDKDAFAEVVQYHIGTLTRLATYLLHSADAAEDVTQTVFVELWKHRATLDPNRPLRPYLLRSLRNRALDEQRKETVRGKYLNTTRADAFAGTVANAVPSPENVILEVATVQAAMRQLGERRQVALRLRIEEGLADEEVAEVLGISAQAASRLVRRALGDLREILLESIS